MFSERDAEQSADTRTARERALDAFLAADDEEFAPVPETVLEEIRAVWPE
jgi:hypothetical protein